MSALKKGEIKKPQSDRDRENKDSMGRREVMKGKND